MCLTTITKQLNVKKPFKDVRWAYKVFHPHQLIPKRLEYMFFSDETVVIGKWHRATNGVIRIARIAEYRAGFHAYLSKRDAEARAYWNKYYVVVRIKVRGIQTFGTQSCKNVLVAREMFIPYSECPWNKKKTKKKKG